ncbi:MAG TPA: electron-transfer flavoprotein:ubiquinone oxidoreductase [Gemmatimonadales bacterium]|nr:electron-transfer flavoprotein:ubiquinone oxidoreductase [Gemmatimonadales bacterium]
MPVIPSLYSPPVQPGEFIVPPQAAPDERIEVGVLFVGGGPAGLAGAIRLAQLLESAPDIRDGLGEVPIAVVEKGKYPGAHLVSGAVVNPVAFRHLFPEMSDSDLPFRGAVSGEAVYFLTARGSIRIPTPPTMRNHGNYTASIAEIGRWLGERAEALGVMLLNETTATHLLEQDNAIQGIRTGDKGLGRDGTPLSNYEPGTEIHARATVLAEGVIGHLTQSLVRARGLEGDNPQIYALGVKEVWEVARPLDRVIHTMGWPLSNRAADREFGGTFIYPMGPSQVSIGLVVGLDYADSSLSAHDLLQEFKLHPLVRPILAGGSRHERGWGAKSIPEGGWYAIPRRLAVPGALLSGDAAGLVNVPALKGIHYAMWSGILAAEAIFAALKDGRDPKQQGVLDGYDRTVRESFIGREMYRVRNMRQAMGAGLVVGGALAGLMTVTRGLLPGGRFRSEPDAAHAVRAGRRKYARPDGKQTFDKLSSVYASGNRTRDTQPNHIRIRTDVPEELASAWIAMCPAAVYEWSTDETGARVLRVNPPNCVQCGAISAKGGRFTPPEGGSGPEYTVT